MIEYKIDESSEIHSEVEVVNKHFVRLYFDRIEVPTEYGTMYKTKYLELKTQETNPKRLAKSAVILSIQEYDLSENVKVFYYNRKPIWFEKALRKDLMLRLNAEKNQGISDTIIWNGKEQINLTVDDAIEMLNKIEVYASKVFDTTNLLINRVNKMVLLHEILHFDYENEYPEKVYINN